MILSQFGGSTPSFNPFGPGGINFGRPGGTAGTGQVNTYYEIPLDENIKRINDPSLSESSLSIEKRLEVYHSDIESDLKGYILADGELRDLKRSDNSLRFVKILDQKPETEEPQEPIKHVGIEMLLDAVRMNTDEKHPYEDVNPPTIHPTRRHTMSQVYINRGTGVTPFMGVEKEGDHRSTFDKARLNTPPDGNPRSYPYKTQKEIDNYLKNPEDVNFEGLYGEALAFDHPQDPENEEDGYKGMYDIIRNLLKKTKGKGNTEEALAHWRDETEKSQMAGPGKPRNMFDYFGDEGNEFNTIRGVGDKFPFSPEKSVGLPNWSFSKS
jgi:hypothetical protein